MYIIDRFEENFAVIECEDKSTFNIPRAILPRNAKEGDVIILSAKINKAATTEFKNQHKGLLDNFFDE